MKKRIAAVIGVGILSIGLMTSGVFSLTPSQEISTGNQISQEKVDYNINRRDQTKAYQDMLQILRENGYKDLSKAHQTGDYEYIDEFMNTMTDEDYENMISIMEASDYGYMADMMRRVDRDQMLEMHNAMGGAASCHGTTEETPNNMMNGY